MDWNSSILWGIIGLIGGFTSSFFFYKLSNKTKKIVYSINSKVLITDNLSSINGLNISYFGKPIKDLSTTTVSFKSTGKDIIEMNDFAKLSPLYIKTNGEFLLKNSIESTITNNSNPLNSAKPIVIDSSTIAIEYDYFSQNDFISFTFFHTGELEVTGKMKKGILINDTLNTKRNFIMEIATYIILTILIIAVTLIYFLFNGISSTITNIINCGINLIIGLIIINYSKRIFDKYLGVNISISNSTIKDDANVLNSFKIK